MVDGLLRSARGSVGDKANERQGLLADVSVAKADPFVSRQFAQPHRATSVEFLRADADFSAQAKLVAIRPARGGVDIDGSGIHPFAELFGGVQTFCHDGFAVFGAVMVDVLNGFIQIIHDLHGEDKVKEFGCPIFFRCGLDIGEDFLRYPFCRPMASPSRKEGASMGKKALFYQHFGCLRCL